MSSDVVTPLKIQKKNIDKPVVNDKLNLPRKQLSGMLQAFLLSIGKKSFIDKESSRGNKVVHHCEGKRIGFCPFEVIWTRCIINGAEFWHVSSVTLDHTGCTYALKKPSLKLLLEDEEMVSLASKTKKLPDIVSHGKNSKELTIHPKQASRFKLKVQNNMV